MPWFGSSVDAQNAAINWYSSSDWGGGFRLPNSSGTQPPYFAWTLDSDGNVGIEGWDGDPVSTYLSVGQDVAYAVAVSQ